MSALIKDIRVNPRYDLQVPYVLINYEQTADIAGVTWLTPSQDVYPNPPPTSAIAQFRAIRSTIDLQGLKETLTQATLVCAPIVATDPNWWLQRHPQYRPYNFQGENDPQNPVSSFTIVSGSITYAPTNQNETLQGYSNELVDGQLAPWMSFRSQRITISCKANIVRRDGTVTQNHPITYQCNATTANSGTFTSTQITQFPEPTPVGLAQFLYNATAVLQYEGELTLQEAEVSAQLSIGNLFNLTGGNLVEWSTMKAQVQSITENLDTGQTLVQYGPPKHLGPGDLMDLLRVNRSRTVFYWPTLQTSGIGGGGGGNVALGSNTSEKNSTSAQGYVQSLAVTNAIDPTGIPMVFSQVVAGNLAAFTQWLQKGPFTPNTGNLPPANVLPANPPGSVTISTFDIAAADIAKGYYLKLQKLSLCQNGVSGSMYFLCSNFVPDS